MHIVVARNSFFLDYRFCDYLLTLSRKEERATKTFLPLDSQSPAVNQPPPLLTTTFPTNCPSSLAIQRNKRRVDGGVCFLSSFFFSFFLGEVRGSGVVVVGISDCYCLEMVVIRSSASLILIPSTFVHPFRTDIL
jgi:hypothetical protein